MCSTSTRTQRLDDYLLKNALDSSAIGTERLVREKIADVSNDSIIRIIKKTPLINSHLVIAALDDFALKKRHRYGTILINAETHKVVDMIESR